MIGYISRFVIPPAFALLPERMRSPDAASLVLSIGWQESLFNHRVQVGGGPARGFWQFEQRGGINGVLGHEQTRDPLSEALRALKYDPGMSTFACYNIVAHNDILACVFARLLLWTLPWPLPGVSDREEGWRQYIAAWRPGKPHARTWPDAWSAGWAEPRLQLSETV